MTREEFSRFVEDTIEEVICLAEQECGKTLPRTYAFKWLGSKHPLLAENVVEHIVQRVFVDENHIYPCVDMGVGDVLGNGTLLIVANVAGYAPRPFGDNWKGRKGPFIHVVGMHFLDKMAGRSSSLLLDGSFSYVSPNKRTRK